MRRLMAVALWAAIAAAFVGPGTVATCAAAGAAFGLRLAWALTFSTSATFVLQEAAARLTIASGSDLGRALVERTAPGLPRAAAGGLAAGAVVLGCAAYQAGNLLGAAAGLRLLAAVPQRAAALAVAALAAGLLWLGSARRVARALALVVAGMGAAFAAAALGLAPPPRELAAGLLLPSLPAGSAVLALALVGTTVVPYNLFLGSRLAAGERIGETRFGLAVAVGAGGAISLAIVVVGTAVSGPLDFPALAAALAHRLGPWAAPALGFGLFAAGLSSAVTAPLAAAVTLRSVARRSGPHWDDRGRAFRAVWLAVLAAGAAVAALDVRPVPAIVAAQALNGVVLPLVATFLAAAVNDRRLMGEHVNGRTANLALLPVLATAYWLGGTGVARAAAAALGRPAPGPLAGALLAAAGAVIAAGAWRLSRRR